MKTCTFQFQGKGLVLGCYETEDEKGNVKITRIGEKFCAKADGLANLIAV